MAASLKNLGRVQTWGDSKLLRLKKVFCRREKKYPSSELKSDSLFGYPIAPNSLKRKRVRSGVTFPTLTNKQYLSIKIVKEDFDVNIWNSASHERKAIILAFSNKI